MSLPRKEHIYIISDKSGNVLYRNSGTTQRMAIAGFSGTGFTPWLPQNPKGWYETQISFGTNFNYWSLNRAFSAPMFFIGDGADMCRDAIYSGKGYEEELYISILNDPGTGIFELEYKGRLAFSKHIDKPRHGITVNSIEGGILSFITANESVPYEIKCDETNPDAILVRYTGTNLYDRYRYSVVDFTTANVTNEETFTLPFPFISNEGDSVGIIQGSQIYDVIKTAGFSQPNIDTYCAGSANYSFSSISPIQLKITGTLRINIKAKTRTGLYIFFQTSLGAIYILIGSPPDGLAYTTDTQVELIVNQTINLAANEKLFLIAFVDAVETDGTDSAQFITSDLFYAFVSANPISTAYGIPPLPMLKSLVSNMTGGRYTADSNFFRTHKNIIMTSTNALRLLVDTDGNPSGRVVQQNFKDFFNDYDCLYNMGIKIVDNVLWMEPKKDLYKDDVNILDLGEIANLEITYAEELLCNRAKFGYKSQDYRQRNGNKEFNTTTTFKFPVDTIDKEYTKICKARGDCFGIEFIRSLAFDKPTTDTPGDNQTFLVNVRPLQEDITTPISFVAAGNDLIVENGIFFVIGDQITFTGSTINDDGGSVRTVTGVGSLFGLAQLITITGGALFVNEGPVSVFIHFVVSKMYTPKRASYTSITGVLDDTVYNIEEMTPHRMMLAHGNTLRALMSQFDAEQITYQTADKNGDLVTTLDGVTIAEKQPEHISGLGDRLFYNRYLNFTTPVPLTFYTIFLSLGTGYIKGTFRGIPVYGLPIGTMDGKPASNEAQKWKLLAAPNNDPEVLKMLSLEGGFTIDVMGNIIFTSDLNTLHFNKYNFVQPPKYKHYDMYDDQFQNRKDGYISGSSYLQKVQKTEPIPVQCITRGIGVVNVDVYNEKGNVHFTSPMTIFADPSVQLPYICNNYEIDISAYPSGRYMVVLSSGGINLRISEWIDIQDVHEGTLLYEFSHTTSKYNTYFTGLSFSLRVESKLLAWYPDSVFESYQDEPQDNEVLDGIPIMKRQLRIPPIPDWMANKLMRILLLNRTYIEGIRYSRTAESKFEKKEYPGHDMKSYIIEISKAINTNGLATAEDGITDDDLTVIYTIDGKAVGFADDGLVINIEVPLEP